MMVCGMEDLVVQTAAEQVAAFLRRQLARRVWSGQMPGGERLSRQLGVGRMTVEAALEMLENEGFLVSQGPGRRRGIVMRDPLETPRLRIGILLYAPNDAKVYYNVDLLHRLLNAGHSAEFAAKSLTELSMDPARVARLVSKTVADAWVVFSASREVLAWFVEHDIPTFAFAGRRRSLPIASIGPDKELALRCLMERLIELGHRRIVMLAREELRMPKFGAFERVFRDELDTHGIPHGSYNLPDWEETADGLAEILDSLWRHTPPTALIIGEAFTFVAAQQHLAQKGILAPRDVSLICDDPDPIFAWCRPEVSHIHWDGNKVGIRAVRWASNVAQGKKDLRMSFTKAQFVEGGTIGPPPGKLEG